MGELSEINKKLTRKSDFLHPNNSLKPHKRKSNNINLADKRKSAGTDTNLSDQMKKLNPAQLGFCHFNL